MMAEVMLRLPPALSTVTASVPLSGPVRRPAPEMVVAVAPLLRRPPLLRRSVLAALVLRLTSGASVILRLPSVVLAPGFTVSV